MGIKNYNNRASCFMVQKRR